MTGQELDFSGLDAQRPLPPGLRARLEAAMLAAASGGGLGDGEPAVPVEPVPLDAPRPLPPAVRERLESVLVGAPPSGAAAAGGSGHGGRGRRPAWLHPVLAVAAVLAVLLGAVAVLRPGAEGSGERQVATGAPTTATTEGTAPEPTTTTATGPEVASAAPTTVPTQPAEPGAGQSPAPASAAPAPAVSPPAPEPGQSTLSPTGDSSPAAPTPGGTAAPESEGDDPGPAPPYAYPPAPDHAAAPASPPAANAAPSPARSEPAFAGTLRVGVVGGEGPQRKGFSAYVDLLNQSGGVRGHRLELVSTGPSAGPAGVVATVNLSDRPVATSAGAPAWVAGPLLETLNVTEDLLGGRGRVYSFASPLERQAHLAADAVYPQAALPGTTAVIYRAPDGPYSAPVVEGFRQVLSRRGVTVRVEVYDPAKGPARLVGGADAAFLSLETGPARSWLADARAAGYRPSRGVAGIASLFDPVLLAGSGEAGSDEAGSDQGSLPEGARVVSPYVVPPGDEGAAIRSGAGTTSAAALHGWATAKSLAVALWKSGADTPEEVQAALDGLDGYSSGLAPPYETRPGTRSRTPEGALFEVRSQAFTADDRGFRRDSH